MLSYQWQGIDVVLGRITALADLRGLDGDLEDAGDTIVTAAQDYPPERPGQRYVRTYTLRGGWRRAKAQRAGQTIEVVVANAVAYAPLVQGESQAWMHQGRWKRLRAIGQEQQGQIQGKVQAWALRTWRGG